MSVVNGLFVVVDVNWWDKCFDHFNRTGYLSFVIISFLSLFDQEWV